MNRKVIACIGFVCVFWFLLSDAVAADKVLKMSTTTSTQSSGLLDLLLPEFKTDTGISVKVIAKGTGAAIRDGHDGNVDVIFVHAKSRENIFVADGLVQNQPVKQFLSYTAAYIVCILYVIHYKLA